MSIQYLTGSKNLKTSNDKLNTIKTSMILFLFPLLFVYSCGQDTANRPGGEEVLKLANAYYTNGLFQASVNTYLEYLENYPVDAARRANTYYIVADIYFERIHDYDKALENYFKIKYLYPESKLQGEVGKKIVNCLERLQRSTDASRIMAEQSALDRDEVEENRPGKIVAEIGERKISQGDLDFQIAQLPAYMQGQFNTVDKKREYLKQFIVQELLYDSAKRKGLDKDKEVLEAAFRAQKSLMAEKLLQQELKDEVKIEPSDIELYYMAHKEKYVEKDDSGEVTRQKDFNESAQQAAQDLSMERQQQAYQKLMERLMQAENVKIHENLIK